MNLTLRVLNVSECGIPGPTHETIDLLTSCNSYPQMLKLTLNRYLNSDPPEDLIIRADQEEVCPPTPFQVDELTESLGLPEQHLLLDDWAVSKLCDFLKNKGGALTVAFPGNEITSVGALAVANVLSMGGSEVRYVDLSENLIDDTGGCAFAAMLLDSDRITDVNLSSNKLTDSTAMQILSTIRKSSIIKDVNLSGNLYISEQRLEEINWFLTLNHKTEEYKELARRLIDFDVSLTHLDLRGATGSGLFDTPGVGYADDSLPLLLRIAARSPQVLSINLQTNGRTLVDMVDPISDFCRSSLNLACIDLSYNPLSNANLSPLLSVASFSLSLKRMILSHCQLPDTVWDSVEAVICGSNSIEFIDLRSNSLTSAVLHRLRAVCSERFRRVSESGVLLVPQTDPLDDKAVLETGQWVHIDAEESSDTKRTRELKLAVIRPSDSRRN